jgi:hypothetical protein
MQIIIRDFVRDAADEPEGVAANDREMVAGGGGVRSSLNPAVS